MVSANDGSSGSKDGAAIDNEKATVDITGLVEECAASLTFADPFLCNSHSFSLHDAMAASQLMDPKMDCCEISASLVAPHGTVIADEGKLVSPKPTPSGLGDTFTELPWENLTLQHAAFIGLEILIRLQSLLSGASVGESTFTCLYAHRAALVDMKSRLVPDSLAEKMQGLNMREVSLEGTGAQFIVFAMSLALVDTSDVARGIILNADIYEEEDFVANTHGLDFLTEQEEVDTLAILDRAMTIAGGLDGQGTREVEVIILILGFQFEFLSACTALGRLDCKTLHHSVESNQKIIHTAVEKLENLQKSIEYLMKDYDSDEIQSLIKQSFDPYVNRPLVGNAPVRKVSFKPLKESISTLLTIVSEIDWSMCDLLLHGSTMVKIKSILERVTQSNVNILSRSLIILNLYFEDKLLGQYSMRELIVRNMQQWSHIPESLLDNHHSRAFLNRLAKPIYETLKLLTLNRHRQRGYIEAVMLPDWTSLQHEAHLVDVNYRRENGLDNNTPPYFSQYVLSILIGLMDRHIAAGLEAGIFHGHVDISIAYWYRSFLLSALVNNLSLMRKGKQLFETKTATSVPASTAKLRQVAKGQRGKKKNKNKNKVSAVNASANNLNNSIGQISEEDKQVDFELATLELKRNLCRGLVRFIAAIRKAGFLKEQTFEFTSMECIFENRFAAFQAIRQPPPLSYADYIQGCDSSSVSQEDLLRTTSEWFQSCKKNADQLTKDVSTLDSICAPVQQDDVRSLVKVCVGNSVYLLKLNQLVNVSGEKPSTEVVFDFQGHDQFCMITLV